MLFFGRGGGLNECRDFLQKLDVSKSQLYKMMKNKEKMGHRAKNRGEPF